jgi:hypothetical protein
MAAEEPIIIRRVRRDGTIGVLGEWRPTSKELVLNQPGFPLTPPGIHHIDGDLPWVFDEMAPDGFFATAFAAALPELSLPDRRALWSADNVLQVISHFGEDLSGNLVVGDASVRRFLKRDLPDTSGTHENFTEGLETYYEQLIGHVLATPQHSSVGGARPKIVMGLPDGRGVIVKFTPPLSTPAGRRWSDLLRMEAHVSDVFRNDQISAVSSRYVETTDRGFLEVRRFDRFAGGGRAGHVTLFNLGVALYGEASDPLPIIEGLVHDGHLPAMDEDTFRRVHSFSRAIANDDAHPGNYGLVIDDDGKARLAPAYDVLPMAFAPKHDELPDRLVKHTGPRDADTDRLVQRLIAAVEADAGISAGFRETWLRVVA